MYAQIQPNAQPRDRNSSKFALSACLVLSVALAGLISPARATTAAVSVQGSPVQPADSPVLVDVAYTNTGAQVVRYGSDGTNNDTATFGLSVQITRESSGGIGKSIVLEAPFDSRLHLTPDNWTSGTKVIRGQRQQVISTWMEQLLPRKSLTKPIVIPLLPPGDYTLQFTAEIDDDQPHSAEDAQRHLVRSEMYLRVKQSNALLAARNEALVARIGRGDYFAARLVSDYHLTTVAEASLANLDSDNASVAANTARLVETWYWHGYGEPGSKLPPDATAYLILALQKHFHDPDLDEIYQPNKKQRDADEVWDKFPMIARAADTQAVLNALLRLIRDNPGRYVPWRVLGAVSRLKLPDGVAELHALLADPDPIVRQAAAANLAENDDVAALPTLLALVKLPLSHLDEGRLSETYNGLATFAAFDHSGAAEAAIQAGIRSPDYSTNMAAKCAQINVQAFEDDIKQYPGNRPHQT